MRTPGVVVIALLLAPAAFPQTTAESVTRTMQQPLQNSEITAWQIRRYVVGKVPKLVLPGSAAEWTTQAGELRRRALEVAFHGWPKEWIDPAPKFEDLGYLPAGEGYRLRRLRFEIVPGFQASALLYEPQILRGKVPAILNVNGHEQEGKAMEYIQKRCINQARRGILALNLEWIGMGELAAPENVHWNEAYLDLAGANGLGVFYLEMRRGLDYLWQLPGVDRTRIGVTGLSGGGWQSIVLGALDERVTAALPDAGYLASLSLGGVELVGDNEQSATDFNSFLDYTHLTAMRAPRPTLLIFNEDDNCCFRAPRMKQFLYDAARPFFALYGAADKFHWYANTDPGDHNYQLDNRMHSYQFFAKYFGLPPVSQEIPADADIKSREELNAGLPKDNLNLLTLARQFASQIARPGIPADPASLKTWADRERERLKQIVRYHSAGLDFSPWPVANSWGGGLKTIGYRFDFSNGLSADATWLKSTVIPDSAPWTVVLDDRGKKESGVEISDRVNRGEQVLAADLLFFGDAATPKYYYPVYDRMLAMLGDRSLGMEAAQLIGIVDWLRTTSGHRAGRIEVSGMRTQAVALVAAAIDPSLFSQIVVRKGLDSWSEVFAKPIRYQDDPELFCLDLFKYFDLDRLTAMAHPDRVESTATLEFAPEAARAGQSLEELRDPRAPLRSGPLPQLQTRQKPCEASRF
ncbi:MAG: alpha/beta hydrolase family protein [Bryobacteraceae bacterium]